MGESNGQLQQGAQRGGALTRAVLHSKEEQQLASTTQQPFPTHSVVNRLSLASKKRVRGALSTTRPLGQPGPPQVRPKATTPQQKQRCAAWALQRVPRASTLVRLEVTMTGAPPCLSPTHCSARGRRARTWKRCRLHGTMPCQAGAVEEACNQWLRTHQLLQWGEGGSTSETTMLDLAATPYARTSSLTYMRIQGGHPARSLQWVVKEQALPAARSSPPSQSNSSSAPAWAG
mmetsp:Transcript_26999/g.69597  ORF Transcript_26999/g.69597 Transcript_26999/m.69597 type:complete len:232 (+) Transcript_26999:190-885(+)